jgi:hypothetical protein
VARVRVTPLGTACRSCCCHAHARQRAMDSPPSLARLPAGQPTLIRTTPPPRGLPDVFRPHALFSVPSRRCQFLVSTHPKALPSRIEDEQMAAQIGPGTHNSRRSRTGCAAGEGAEAAPGWSSVAPGEQRCRRGSCDGTRVRETSVSGWTRVPRRKQNE